jgi:hypothetical protein
MEAALFTPIQNRGLAVERIKKGGHEMSEKELLEEIFESALQNDMNYLG